MKVTVTKYEDIEVEVSEEQVEVLMCDLLKEDYVVMAEFGDDTEELRASIKIVYEAYSGKPIDLVERFAH
jgi:stress response protein YsnF